MVLINILSYIALAFAITLNIYKVIKPSRSSSSANENTEDINSTRRSKFQVLRLLSFLAFFLSLMSMLFELVIETKDIIIPGELELLEGNNTGSPLYKQIDMTLSLSHLVFQWLGMTMYSLCLLDRFKRLDMVLQNTRKETVLRVLEIILVVGCCFIIIEEMFLKIRYMVNFESSSNTVNAVFGLTELLQGAFIAILEFVINVRLVKGTLRVIKIEQMQTAAEEEYPVVDAAAANRHQNTGDSKDTLVITKNQALVNFIAKQRHAQKSLRMKIFCYFALLFILDSIIIAGYVIAGVFPAIDQTNLWTSAVNGLTLAAIGLHPHLSFQFLQVLLDGLKEIKMIKPSFNTIHKINHQLLEKNNLKKAAYLQNTWKSSSSDCSRAFDVDNHSTRDVGSHYVDFSNISASVEF